MSKLPADVYRKYVEDVNTTHWTGFTFVILSIVHLAGGKLPEGILSIFRNPDQTGETAYLSGKFKCEIWHIRLLQ